MGGKDDYPSNSDPSDSELDEDKENEESEEIEEESNDESDNDMESEEEEDDDDEEEDKPKRRGMKRVGSDKDSKSKREKRYRKVLDIEAEEDDVDDEEEEAEEGYDIAKMKETEEAYRNLYARKGESQYDKMVKRLEQDAVREEMRLPQPRKVIKETEITHEKGLETDDAALRRQRELQQAAVIEYANARLLPTIQDPKIYSVRVRRGSEMQAILSLTYKYREYEDRRENNNLPVNETYVFSAFWAGEQSIIYIEAHDETMVRRMVEGMSLFLSGYKNAFQLIPINNRTLLLEMKQKNRPIPLNAFVRVKKGLYKGDLGQVVRLMEDSQKVVLKLVPRIDMSEINGGSYSALKVRPEQRRFDPTQFPEDKVERKNNSRLGGMFYEYNRNFYRDGMLYKEFLVNDVLQDVQPSQEEKIMFAERKNVDPAELYNGGESDMAGESGEAEQRDEKGKLKLFFKGDTVKLISGELKNLEGVVESADVVRKEVQVRVAVGDESEVLLLKEDEIMKTFKTGAHVKIIAGVNSGETGTVVLVDEKEGESTGFAIVMSDYGDKEMKVFVNYMVTSVEVNKGLVSVEGFELYDLLPGAKVGIIIQLATQSLTVLDQQNKVKTFDIKLIRSKKNTISRTSTLLDVRQMQVREGDSVLVVEGDFKGKNGVVKRIWRNFVFVHVAGLNENNGIILVRNRQIEADAESQQKKRYDTKDAIESLARRPGAVDFASTKQGSRNKKELLKDGTSVMVKEGRYKGLKGYVFDSNETHVKIVFHSRPRPVSVLRSAVMIIDGSSTDNAEMDMSRFHTAAQPAMPMYPPPTEAMPQAMPQAMPLAMPQAMPPAMPPAWQPPKEQAEEPRQQPPYREAYGQSYEPQPYGDRYGDSYQRDRYDQRDQRDRYDQHDQRDRYDQRDQRDQRDRYDQRDQRDRYDQRDQYDQRDRYDQRDQYDHHDHYDQRDQYDQHDQYDHYDQRDQRDQYDHYDQHDQDAQDAQDAQEPWIVKGARVRLANGSTGVVMEVKPHGLCAVEVDDSDVRDVAMTELQPVHAFAPDQEVMVYDDPNNCFRATVLKVDGEDLLVSAEGSKMMVHNAVVIDVSTYE